MGKTVGMCMRGGGELRNSPTARQAAADVVAEFFALVSHHPQTGAGQGPTARKTTSPF